ncbi:ankyrin repeat domain-containing protein [Thalassococcus profundi]|uniref:Ankyrin repeat domain-containing protein n=1 Tax=Thalassococcus profundi TaxID=2282382 RepID=A0A369TLM5_9RHOB|nr:ankyrin repeat domain-containing protein [Thalassococcus profundi]RDD65564.1 ankyrin repeat domain-containing protein [Thalassococcus profundi]
MARITAPEPDLTPDRLRREAKTLRRASRAGEPGALYRLRTVLPKADPQRLRHADALHVVAREHGFASWPKLKLSAELHGLDRAAAAQRLGLALQLGQAAVAEALLVRMPDLPQGFFGLQVALYDIDAVRAALAREPKLATDVAGTKRPILHLAFSRWIKARPDLETEMLAVAEALVAAGADVNDGFAPDPGDPHRLSALYGAIGHADNMALGRWLLDKGASPDDGESLYHATELGHHEGLRMLLEAGATPHGTNALLRAMDFDDVAAVEMLLAHGARADDFNAGEVGGEQPWVVPPLHQAARRRCSPEMVDLLLKHGADPGRRYRGASVYGFARVHGHAALARRLEARVAAVALTPQEALLAAAAEGRDSAGSALDPAHIPEAYRDILHEIVPMPDRLDHVRHLLALGLPFDQPDAQGLTPVQMAGWAGLPEALRLFLDLGPDVAHVNGYGGGLVDTILHGAANNPARAETSCDYEACLDMALAAGALLPRRSMRTTADDGLRALMEDWAEAHPERVA